jgi:hypothetical protein
MSKPSGAVHLVYDAAAEQAATKNKAAPLRSAIEHYEHYEHLLEMLSDELATVDPEKLQPVWDARIAELETQLDVDALASSFAQALELSRKLTGEA